MVTAYDAATQINPSQFEDLIVWWNDIKDTEIQEDEEPYIELKNNTISGGELRISYDGEHLWIIPTP